jgi:hypothetical protein
MNFFNKIIKLSLLIAFSCFGQLQNNNWVTGNIATGTPFNYSFSSQLFGSLNATGFF